MISAVKEHACKICGGPMLIEDLVDDFAPQHLVDISVPDPPDVAAMSRDPGKQMAARQRAACAAGRQRAVQARPTEVGQWVAAGTRDEDEPYPCRCGEADEWAHAHGRCPCHGRTDTAHLPQSCCAYRGPETPLYSGSAEQANVKTAADEAAEQAWKNMEPDSTVEELRAVLIDYELSRPRSRQVALGPSELGTPCLAQIMRKIAGMPRQLIQAPSWAPFIGTSVHKEMELVVAHWNEAIGRQRWITEDELHCGEGIVGHGDAYDTDTGMVVDWKVTGKTALVKLARAQRAGAPPGEQVSAEYRIQAHLYGAGHAAKGRDVRWVRLVFLARSHEYSDSAEWTERYDPAIAAGAISRYSTAKGLVAALDLANHGERIATVPKVPHNCAWCPFYRPSLPNTVDGCPGDEAMTARAMEHFQAGVVETVTTSHLL